MSSFYAGISTFSGPIYEELEPVRNKALIKQIAEKESIPTAKFAIIDFSQLYDIEKTISTTWKRIGKYPMFAKPIHGVGCGGSATVNDEVELKKWLEEMKEKEKNAVSIVRVVGKEE